MQITNIPDSRYGDHLRLGIQTNADKVDACATMKALSWAPKKAKSYTIRSLVHTDYHGAATEQITGYATIEVEYFTKAKEGQNEI